MEGFILILWIFNQFLIFPKKKNKQTNKQKNMKEILGNGYLRRSVGGILLLKAKRFEKMYSKKTDARGILPNTFRLLRKNYYYPLRM